MKHELADSDRLESSGRLSSCSRSQLGVVPESPGEGHITPATC